METVSVGTFWGTPAAGEPYQSVTVEEISPALAEVLDIGLAYICEGCTKLSGKRLIHFAYDDPHGDAS